MGRHSEYTPEVGAVICERIANGESVRTICRDEAMPVMSTVFKWLLSHPTFAEQYAHARDAQADALADEILDISDDGSRDYVADENGGVRVDHDHIARSRLRVDTRKWIASKLKPKKYGDRIEIETTQKHSADQFTDDELAAIASRGSDGAAKAKNGKEKSSRVH